MSSRPAHIPALDGVRAVAILMVVAFHLAPLAVPGGFIGVDVFFVLSGYLITAGLLREHASGGVSFRAFWERRIRRLLPVLALVVLACTSAALVVGGDLLVDVDRQVLGAATFSSNWLAITGGDSYFAALAPQLFANLWSLAVEEQFYLVWPLLLVALLAVLRRRWAAGAAAAIAGLSAGAMALGFRADADPTAVYYATHTRVFGLMVGAVVAFVAARWTWAPASRGIGWVRRGAPWALGALLLAAAALPWESAVTYRGGLLAVSVAAAVVVLALVTPGAAPGLLVRALATPPAVWVGRRSYGMYLWHWPILVLLTQMFAPQYRDGSGVPFVWTTTIVLTVALSAASYRWVERPVVELGWRGAARALRAWALPVAPGERGPLHPRAVAVAAGLVVTVSMTTAAAAIAPRESATERQILAGQALVIEGDEEDEESDERPATEPPTTVTPAPSSPPAAPDPTPEAVVAVPEPEATPSPQASPPEAPSVEAAAPDAPAAEQEPAAPVDGRQVTVIGDSVTLASAAALAEALPKARIDADVARPMAEAPALLKELERKGKLRDVVVLSLATNSTLTDKQMDDVMAVVGPDRQVVLVNGFAERRWIRGTNKELARAAERYPNVAVADWAGTIKKHTDELAGDGIHPSEAGARRYARLVHDACVEAAARL